MEAMQKVLAAVLLSTLIFGSAWGEILRVEINGVIDPITSEFITSSVQKAEEAQAEFLLIRLATPGGLGISMQEIVQAILNSQVPVVCYVAPQGAHAASAGFFILLAADVAAMAPGTNTGAAHPVFPFGMENQVMLEKVRNDALASLRAIVKQRNRNYDLAEQGVLESKSFTAAECLEGELINLIADSEEQLLEQLDNLEITRFSGEKQLLRTSGVPVVTLEMTPRQRLLTTIADPNFALVLGVIGILGLYFEFNNPGLIVPGVIGGICLLLAALGFSLLPVNLIGVLLILLGIGLLVAEVKVQGFGILGFGGVVALLLGMIFLIDSPYPELRIDVVIAFAVAIPFALIFLFLVRLVLRSHRQRVTTGEEGLAGEEGTSRTEVTAEGGWVMVDGELWKATSMFPIPAGSRVRVLQARRLELQVELVESPQESTVRPV